MPAITCALCGRLTNSAVSEYWDYQESGQAQGCYLSYVNDQWVTGCLYESVSPIMKPTYDRMIAEGTNWNTHPFPRDETEGAPDGILSQPPNDA